MATLRTVDNTFDEYYCARCAGLFTKARKRTWIVGTKRNLCMTCTLIVEGKLVYADGRPDFFRVDWKPGEQQQQPAKPVTKTQQRDQSDLDAIFHSDDEIPF